MKIEMTYKKSTKNTYVFEEVNPDRVPTMYIKKTAFSDAYPGSVPNKITVTIDVNN